MKSLFKVHISDELLPELEKVIYSGQLVSGRYRSEFEKLLASFVGVPYVDVVNSYSTAATMMWQLIDLQPGDEVIASPMSCLASNQPVAVKGGRMRWTDIDPQVGSLDPRCVEKNINDNTKAILHYHWCGYPGYIDEIIAIGRKHGIPVIQDGIESFGSEYKGEIFGKQNADYVLFSFQPVRLPTSIEGGGIICKSKEDREKLLLMRDYGIDRSKFRDAYGEISPDCDITMPGFGAGMNEINALVGYFGMKEIKELLIGQRIHAQKNLTTLNELTNVVPLGLPNTLPNYWVHSFLVDNRDKVMLQMREKGLYASKVHLRNDHYSVFGDFDDSLKGVADFQSRVLSIPSGWWLTNE